MPKKRIKHRPKAELVRSPYRRTYPVFWTLHAREYTYRTYVPSLLAAFATNLKSSFKLCAWLVHGFVAFHELHHEDGEVLIGARADRDGHRTHAGGTLQMNLQGRNNIGM